MPQPLRRHSPGGNEELESPEALLISAYLESGQFTPSKHHISTEDVEAWRKLWDLLVDYHEKTGTTPPAELVHQRFPDFEPTPGVSVTWAADQLRKASAARSLRVQTRAMLAALAEDDLDGAYEAIASVAKPRGFVRDPADVFDHALLADKFAVTKIEVPYPTLMRASHGGIGEGELWYLAARFGQGKSWEMLGYAAKAAMCGCKVAIASLEMPASQVGFRSLVRLAGRDTKLVKLLHSDLEFERKEAADMIRERTPGSVAIFDPSHGRVNSTGMIEDLANDYDIVFVDHVGLMQNHERKRAVDDWRVMAGISNMLREITLSSHTPIFGIAQINREGGKTGARTPPKASDLAQSDALGQDADAVITMKRISEGGRVMINSAEKMREGPMVRWYTLFDPAKGRFEEITLDEANEYDLNDELVGH